MLALVYAMFSYVCHFPIGVLGQSWYLIVSIPNLCIHSSLSIRFASFVVACLWYGWGSQYIPRKCLFYYGIMHNWIKNKHILKPFQ